MTIAYLDKGALAATSAASLGGTFSTITPALPSHSTGNLLLALVGIEATDTPVTVPAPSGWTQLAKTSGTNRQVFLFGKVAASGSETNPTFDPTGENGTTQPPNNSPFMAQCFAFSGTFSLATLGNLVSASITPAPSATADWTIESGGTGAETLDVTENNTLVLWAWLWTNDANDQTALSNFTVGDTQYTQLGNDATIGWQYWIQTTATDVTNQTSTVTPVLYAAISNITKANPGQVTTSAAHGFSSSTTIRIANVSGMTQVNNTNYTITVVDSTNFTIGVDTSAYSTYTSGGNAGEVGQNISLMVSLKETASPIISKLLLLGVG